MQSCFLGWGEKAGWEEMLCGSGGLGIPNHSESQKDTLGPFSGLSSSHWDPSHPNTITTDCEALEGAAQRSGGVTIP